MEVTTSAGTSETQVPTTPVTGTNAPGGAMPQKSSLSLEEAMQRISELEHTSKNATEERDRHRKKLSAYEEAEKKAQEASLSEIERVKKANSELQAQHELHVRQTQERIVRYEVEKQASKLGIIDPEAAARLMDWSQLEYEDDGTPKNAEKLLEQLLKNKPYLGPASAQDGKQTTPGLQKQAPALPAMNPGRTSINPPGHALPGKPPRLSDVYKRS